MAASPWIVFATEYDPFLIPDSNKQLNNDLPLSSHTGFPAVQHSPGTCDLIISTKLCVVVTEGI